MPHGKTLPDVLADLGRIVMECAGSDGCFMSIDGHVMLMLNILQIIVGYSRQCCNVLFLHCWMCYEFCRLY